MTERDEYTLVCPPGEIDTGIAYASGRCPENIREVVESPLVDDFTLINDTQLSKFFEDLRNEPIKIDRTPRLIDRYTLGPVVNNPGSLINITGV